MSLLGYVLWVGKSSSPAGSREFWATAQGPLYARWLQHAFGTRRDDASYRLLARVPGVSPLALYLVSGPTLLAHRLTGHVPKAFRHPFEGQIPVQYEASARQTFFDGVVERHLTDVAQLVVLGAGFDTRALRLPREARVRAFEVDAPGTQATKREVLKRAGVDASRVTFFSADLEKEDWLARLVEAGYDRGKPGLFLWEGVTVYLEEEAVGLTLRRVASTAKGTLLAFDYFTIEPLQSQTLYWRYGRAAARAAGEPLKFGFDSTPPSRERVAEFLASCGLSLLEQRTLGEEGDGRRAWGGFAVAIVG